VREFFCAADSGGRNRRRKDRMAKGAKKGKVAKKPAAGYKTRLIMAMADEMRELRETTNRIFAQFDALAKAEGVSIAGE